MNKIHLCWLLLLAACTHVQTELKLIPRPVLFERANNAETFRQGEIVTAILEARDPELGDEGYQLRIAPTQVVVEANTDAGVFYGKQTVIQAMKLGGLSTGIMRDYPRFAWRGAMLDIARHFFNVGDILRYIDLLALYKINRLHLHLTANQGWRIEIKSWPKLTSVGAKTQLGGEPGGFLTQEDYAYVVAYAKKRFITVIPEIDVPAHATAMLASYPELGCTGFAPSIPTILLKRKFDDSLCVNKEEVFVFLDDVIGELARLTPGAYIHIGGDEAMGTPKADYAAFISRVEKIVQKYGKTMIGWEEILGVPLSSDSIVQMWLPTAFRAQMGALCLEANTNIKRIVSTANKAYLDMRYSKKSPLGQSWAGFIDSKTSYDWDPAKEFGESNVLGIEAPLWTEYVESIADVEYMAFPRMMSYAEVAWSPQYARDFTEYKRRAATHGPMLTKMGVSYFADPKIPW